jgi:DUF3048 family protein
VLASHLVIRGPFRGWAAISALALALAACGGGNKAQPSRPNPQSSAPAAAPRLCPLTGTPASSGVDVGRPALAVKLDNAPEARPQAGIEAADVVYEELAEGGITRFMAIFQCNDAARLGPVRSARLVDPDILVQYQPVLFSYSGGNGPVLAKVRSTQGIVDLEHGTHGSAYQRVSGRAAPHNLFTSTDKLRAFAKDVKGPPRTGFVFEAPGASGASGSSPSAAPSAPGSPGAAGGAGPGAAVTFAFAGAPDHRYTYDAGSGSYLRFQGLNTAFKAESGAQVKASNVVVMKVRVVQSSLKAAAGNFSPDISIVGSGDVIVLRRGVSVKGRWSRPSPGDQTKLVDASGKPIALTPGNTWIHLVPESQAVTIS